MIGIIVKQWLKEYSTGLYGNSRDIARRRQYRYDNLKKWRVGMIVAVIPVLLLTATVLFLAGLLVLLYNIHHTVAEAVSAFVGLLFLFITTTTILPAVSRSCCYYSPQAYALFTLRYFVFHVNRSLLSLSVHGAFHLFGWITDRTSSWPLMSCYRRFEELKKANFPQWRTPRVWRSGEVSFGQEAANLDLNILVTSYSATLDAATINTSIAACVSDRACRSFWMDYISKLKEIAVERSGPWKHMPAPIREAFEKAVRYMARIPGPIRDRSQGPGDITQEGDASDWMDHDSETSRFINTLWEDDPAFANDLHVHMLAVVSAWCKTDTRNGNQAWDMMLSENLRERMRNPSTCIISM